MVRQLLYLSLFIGGFALIAWAFPVDAIVYPQEPNWGTCLQVFDGGMRSNAQREIRFYNGCPERLFINACVTSDRGDNKLYQSGRSIMTNGNFSIYTFPFVTPAAVRWSASRYQAAIPPPCS